MNTPTDPRDEIASRLGVEWEPSYSDESKVRRLRFSFPPAVWGNLGNADGELLPSCCANISSIRDVLVQACRDDGWVDVEGLERIDIDRAGHEFAPDHPVSVVQNAYQEFRRYLGRSDGLMTVDFEDQDSVEWHVATSVVWEWCSKSSARRIFHDWGKSAHDRANYNATLREVLPALRALYRLAESSDFPPVDGWAAFHMAKGQVFRLANERLAIWDERGEAERVVGHWIKSGEVGTGVVAIRRCRVSLENGVELLGDIP